MSRNVGIFDGSLGIQTVLDVDAGRDPMPKARPLAASVLREAGLEELYAPRNARQIVEQALCPPVGDGEMLRPDVFGANLNACLDALSMERDPAVREFVRNDLAPLLENAELLRAYAGLMVGG
ncbi:MAG: type III secretion protein [Desulfovibrio sp.]|jgi:type III secretion protein X|nr:type III secretion protein [Desulfovibrio sp.]